jgi:hypothetical protein
MSLLVNTLIPFTGYDVAWNQPRPSPNFMNHKELLIGVELVLWRESRWVAGFAAA